MTRIKLCGLKRVCDIEYANELLPDYIGFVFWRKSKRFVDFARAAELKGLLDKRIKAVGVFVDERLETVAELLKGGVIDIAQLHGSEDDDYILRLKSLTDRPIFKAFTVKSIEDVEAAEQSLADEVLLDCGRGEGEAFDWSLAEKLKRRYFLAGGLDCGNIREAIERLSPWGVDVSSGIETTGLKDYNKMKEFMSIINACIGKED